MKEYFQNHFFFYHTGVEPDRQLEQLDAFCVSLEAQNIALPNQRDWLHAFLELRRKIEASEASEKKVIFLDEISWIDSNNDGFMSSLEFFWNSFASSRTDILLVVCSSATTWIIEHLLLNTGGFFNRNTDLMYLSPFTLGECEKYFLERGAAFSRKNVLDTYMVFGGIPYYLNYLDISRGLAENIDKTCFAENAPLTLEYTRLYATLFRNQKIHLRILEAISTKLIGLTRKEIAEAAALSDGGPLTSALEELEQCGIIRKFSKLKARQRGALYQLTDHFSLFYNRFMKSNNKNENFWTNNFASPTINAWRGYAFEQVCLSHVRQIKEALGISGVSTDVSSYNAPGIQIDLVLDRKDDIMNLCEMKYSEAEYVITKAFAQSLENKQMIFRSATKTKKSLHMTLIAPWGLKENAYSHQILNVVTLDDLFR